MRDLMVGQRAGDHADGSAPTPEDGVSHHSHEADGGASVDESDTALGQRRAESGGRRGE